MTKPTLAEQIAALNNPTPSYDPEDVSDTETRAQLVDFEDSDDITGSTEASLRGPSKLRRKNIKLLADTDKRYAGRTTSRKNLDQWGDGNDDDVISSDDGTNAHSDDDDVIENGEDDANTHSDDVVESDDDPMYTHSDDVIESGDDMYTHSDDDVDESKHTSESIQEHFRKIQEQFDEESSDEVEEEQDDDDDKSDADNDNEKYCNDDDDNDDDDNDDDDNDDDDDDDDDDIDDDNDEDSDKDEIGYHSNDSESGMKAFSEASVSEEMAKGRATKTQLTLWDTFMESRIKLQKALTTANQLPAYNKQNAFIREGGKAVQESLHSSSQQLRKLLKKLVDLQQVLLLGNPTTRHIVDGKKEKDEDSDEEITSSEDDDDSTPKQSRQRSDGKSLKRKADMRDLGEFLTKRHKDFAGFQKDTIQKWYDKTKLASGKQASKSFTSFEKSTVHQIQQVLQDRPRLVRRTQLRRTIYRRLGEAAEKADDATQPEEDGDSSVPVNSHLKDYDEETFDDDDFYHQLLRELIEKRTSSTSDPVQLTRQWLEVQRLRRKIKKNVDTKASKGRKIRYDIHQPLVSFMAAKDSGTMMEDARDELFSSLFGKRRNVLDDNN